MRWEKRARLWLALGVAGCESAADAPPRPPLDLVLGAQRACAASVRSVHVEVRSGDKQEFTADVPIDAGHLLPQGLKIDLPPSDQAHSVEATFTVQEAGQPAQRIATGGLLPDGTTGRVTLTMVCVCIGATCPEGTFCTEKDKAKGLYACDKRASCGDGTCGQNETSEWCPQDCKPSCGDDVCSPDETCKSCSKDCGLCCGDGACKGGETCADCPQDCGACAVCGNKLCEPGESAAGCPADCFKGCGDKVCASDEKLTCPADCGAACGNGLCEAGESCASCPKDCEACVVCGDGACSAGETCGGCPADCPCPCGDGTCGPGETAQSCPKDCPPAVVCGDGVCSPTETCQGCYGDCGVPGGCSPLSQRPCTGAGSPGCGTGGSPVCSGYQDCTPCGDWSDCHLDPKQPCACPNAVCGDGACEPGEGSASCPKDCAPAPCGPGQQGVCGSLTCACGYECDCPLECDKPAVCGNGLCECSEDCTSCYQDCGIAGGCSPGNTQIDCVFNAGSCEGTGTLQCPGKQFCNACGSAGTCNKVSDACTCVGGAPPCGNGVCDASETPASCPADCAIVCGPGLSGKCGNVECSCGYECDCDTICDAGATCGNGLCECGEACATCYQDCGIAGGCPQLNQLLPCTVDDGPCGDGGHLQCPGQQLCNACGSLGACAKTGAACACVSPCGDGVCCFQCGETYGSCAADCPFDPP